MSNNNNRLKNGISGLWLKGNTNVYRVFSTNHSKSYLTNKNSLFKVVESNRVRNLKNLNALITRLKRNATTGVLRGPFRWYREFNAGGGHRGPDILYNTANKNRIVSVRGQEEFNKLVTSLGKYNFNKYGHNKRVKVRDPVYGKNLKLINVNPNSLTNANKRTLRKRKYSNNRNEAAELAAMMKRARENAAERARLARQQNTRATQHVPNYLWYDPRNLNLINSNGQSYGRRNIQTPYFTPVTIRGVQYYGVPVGILPQNMRNRRQSVISRFGWNQLSTVFYVRNSVLRGIMNNAMAGGAI
jgi:hypothetical protein